MTGDVGEGSTRRHVWLPGTLAKGGIQTYSTFLLRALLEIEPRTRHEIFLKNDPTPPAWARGSCARLRGYGRYPLRARSAAFALGVSSRVLLARPDHVVVGHLNFCAVGHPLLRATRTPYWVLTYGIESWGVEREILRRGLRDARRIVTISRYSRDRLAREQGLDPDRIDLLPCTFDPEAFHPAEKDPAWLARYGLKADEKVILTVARLAEPGRSKGYEAVLEALPAIRRRIPGVRYLLVGDGPDRPRIEARVRALGLDGAVVFAGKVPDEDLPAQYHLCDVFAMPSKKEGFGIVYLEAMACGKPTIGGRGDGARDALLDGELGVLVDPDDPAEVADAIVSVLHGERAGPPLDRPEELRRRVVDTFGPDRFRDRLAFLLAGEE